MGKDNQPPQTAFRLRGLIVNLTRRITVTVARSPVSPEDNAYPGGFVLSTESTTLILAD